MATHSNNEAEDPDQEQNGQHFLTLIAKGDTDALAIAYWEVLTNTYNEISCSLIEREGFHSVDRLHSLLEAGLNNFFTLARLGKPLGSEDYQQAIKIRSNETLCDFLINNRNKLLTFYRKYCEERNDFSVFSISADLSDFPMESGEDAEIEGRSENSFEAVEESLEFTEEEIQLELCQVVESYNYKKGTRRQKTMARRRKFLVLLKLLHKCGLSITPKFVEKVALFAGYSNRKACRLSAGTLWASPQPSLDLEELSRLLRVCKRTLEKDWESVLPFVRERMRKFLPRRRKQHDSFCCTACGEVSELRSFIEYFEEAYSLS